MIIAAYDFGTTGCKASLFQETGDLIATSYHEYPTYFPKEGWIEQEPEDWKKAMSGTTQEILKKSNIKPTDIACMAFSGHMMGCIPVDKKGTPLTKRAMLWADNRGRPQAKRILESVGWERFYTETGGGLDVSLYPAAKIPWIKENQPEIYRRASKFIGTKDLICAWLTGNVATDYSEASDIGLLHLKGRCWHEEFLRTFGISADKMPAVLPSIAVVGRLTSQIARTLGLVEGIPVVLGGGDVACGSAGAGAVREGVPYMCIGSAAWISVATKDPIIHLSERPMSICHVVPDFYTSQIIMYSAGIAYKWIRDEIFTDFPKKDKAASFAYLDKLAGSSKAGSGGLLFLPYMRPGGAPHYDMNARGAFLGLMLTTKKADLARSVLEGVAFNLRLMIRCIEEKQSFNSIRIIGGGAKSTLWRQIFADILKKDICSLSARQEANTLGAALVGGVGIGLFDDFSAIELFNRIEKTTHFKQDTASTYEELLPTFQKAYESLKKTNESLARFLAGNKRPNMEDEES